MRRSPAVRATLALAFFLAAAYVPASASLTPADVSSATYYLHSDAPVGNVQTVVEFGADTGGPTMDANEPTAAASKSMVASGLGNDQFRKNFLLGYWAGAIAGPLSVENASASLWLQTPADTNVTVTLFGDGGVGIGSPFTQTIVRVAAGGPTLVAFDFAGATTNVVSELVLQVNAGELSEGTTVLYDSATHPSSLSFELHPPKLTPPPSWDPAPGWGNAVLISDTQAQREESLALSPVDPDLMIACAPSGVPNTGNGQSYFHVSRDGGASWSELRVETASTDPRTLAFEGGDCDVAFDAGGNMYSADTWLGSLSVGVSRDGGVTWMGTSLAASAPVVDRPWLVGGPDGVVHVTWQDLQFGMPSAIWYSRSADHGLTWTPATSVATATRSGPFTWTGNLVVAEGGQTLYSIYTRRIGPAINGLDGSGPEAVWVAKSVDAGLTWAQHLVAMMPQPASYLYPSLAMDGGGQLHAAFASRRADLSDRPVWYTRSLDGALTWSAPTAVLSGASAFSPWIVGGAAGEAALQWYGSPDPAANLSASFDWYFYAARVKDGAVTSAGPTTTEPIFTGRQGETPEFNQLRLDADGAIHIGAAAMYTKDGATGWALFYQREL